MSAVFPIIINPFAPRKMTFLEVLDKIDDELRDKTIRERLEMLERSIGAGEQTEIPTRHYFGPGIYAREIFIPRGTVLTGKIHKFQHLNIVSKGDISVLTENGVQRVKAPFTMVSPPGTKRAGYAHEDTVWTTIHGTDETDLDNLEAHFIAKDHAEYLQFAQAQQMIEGDIWHG